MKTWEDAKQFCCEKYHWTFEYFDSLGLYDVMIALGYRHSHRVQIPTDSNGKQLKINPPGKRFARRT